jgi:GT2 family glycosyltransferase
VAKQDERSCGAEVVKRNTYSVGDLDKLQSTLLQTAFFRVDDNSVAGYVVNKKDPSRRFIVELLLDGQPLRIARADAYVEELGRAGIGDGCYGFFFTLPIATIGDGFTVEARLANSGAFLGQPIRLRAFSVFDSDPRSPGSVQWLGGLRFQGRCASGIELPTTISAIVDGAVVAQAPLTRWAHIGVLENAKPVRAFDLHLPQRFADGRVRRAQFLLNNTEEIAGSPATFVAFPDGLERTLADLGESQSERLRARMFDRLFPQSLPFSSYKDWQERFPLEINVVNSDPVAVIIVGPGGDDKTLESLQSQARIDWVAAALPEALGHTGFNPVDILSFLSHDAEACKIILFVLNGTRLASNALQRFVDCLASHPAAAAVYADLEIETNNGAVLPLAFPAFDYERMLEQGYCAHLFAMRRAAVERALQGGTADLYRLFNSQLDGKVSDQAVLHLPGAIGTLPRLDLSAASKALAAATSAHLNARGIETKAEPATGKLLPAVRALRIARTASVTVIIPVRDKPDLLQSCLRSIRPALKLIDSEIIVVDNDSSDPDLLNYLRELDKGEARVLRVPGAFNFSQLNNIAAREAHTDQLLLLNNDVEALDSEWLAELQSRLVEPDVAAVGPLLLWPSRVIQHGGVVLGPSFAATHSFTDRMDGDPGYADLLCVAHGCSAVTAACLLVSRKEYLDVGGMDELHFPVNFNDVDLCLKFRASGKRITFTPHAKLSHAESSTRGRYIASDRTMHFARELATLRARWGDVLVNDPYYSPILSLDAIPFSALAWPPRDRSARLPACSAPTEIPTGL